MTTGGAGKAPASERKSHSVYFRCPRSFLRGVFQRREGRSKKKTRIGRIERRVKWKEQTDLDAETIMRAASATVGARRCADVCRDQIRSLAGLVYSIYYYDHNIQRIAMIMQ
jgi:hypothetical protein